MPRATLSPLAAYMLQTMADRSGLAPEAVAEIAIHDLYVSSLRAEPLGLPIPEAPTSADDLEEGDDASEDVEPVQAAPTASSVTDPDAVKARVLALAESMRESFRSTDLSQALAREGVYIEPRQVGKMLSHEGWPTAEGLTAGLRRWLPLDGR